MIKFHKRPNVANLRNALGSDRAVVNEIRHRYTNYDKVCDRVFASDHAEKYLGAFYRSVVGLDNSLAAEAVSQYKYHVQRLA